MAHIEAGEEAPNFTLHDQQAQPHTLRDLRGGPVVLFFYPKDDTTGCTDEACQFRDGIEDFRGCGASVFGISPQDTKSKAKFAAKHHLPYPVLADDGAAVCDAYGVWHEKSMYGRKYMGVVRTTYLLDAQGKVAQRWDKVKVAGHAGAVLGSLKGLAGA